MDLVCGNAHMAQVKPAGAPSGKERLLTPHEAGRALCFQRNSTNKVSPDNL